MIYVGTSGFSYKEWKGIFYPEKLPAKQFLSFYSQHFNTTEINNTFYQFPFTEHCRWLGVTGPRRVPVHLEVESEDHSQEAAD